MNTSFEYLEHLLNKKNEGCTLSERDLHYSIKYGIKEKCKETDRFIKKYLP